MAENPTLAAQPRDAAATPRALRRSGYVPGVIYGNQYDTVALQFSEPVLRRLLSVAGTTHFIDLSVDGGNLNETVLVRAVQRDPVSGDLLHIDLYRIVADQVITTVVSLQTTGESPTADEGGAVTVLLDSLEVQCLPGDLPDHMVVDLSTLVSMDSTIRVEDLDVPEGVTVLTNAETMVARVVAQRAPEEEEVAEAVAEEAEAEGAEEAAEAEGDAEEGAEA